jgi:hypothetical protein
MPPNGFGYRVEEVTGNAEGYIRLILQGEINQYITYSTNGSVQPVLLKVSSHLKIEL